MVTSSSPLLQQKPIVLCAALWAVTWLTTHQITDALLCYKCENSHDNTACTSNNTEGIERCPDSFDTCMGMVKFSEDIQQVIINKHCTKREPCARQKLVSEEQEFPCDRSQDSWSCVECCQRDLCNVDAAVAGLSAAGSGWAGRTRHGILLLLLLLVCRGLTHCSYGYLPLLQLN